MGLVSMFVAAPPETIGGNGAFTEGCPAGKRGANKDDDRDGYVVGGGVNRDVDGRDGLGKIVCGGGRGGR